MRPQFLPFPAVTAAILILSAANHAPAQASLAGDADRGKQLFQQNCALCHATGLDSRPTGQGPMLAGVVGRQAGSRSDFGYSQALANSHLTWTTENLKRFLSGPAAMVPGTNMPVTVASADDRADIVAFLATLKPAAAPAAEPAAAAAHGRTAGDWENDAPGVTHRIRLDELPPPFATKSAGNSPKNVKQPEGAHLSVPEGFEVKLFASGLSGPRLMRTAPNGDVFVAETRESRIRVIRMADGAEAPEVNQVFADGLQGAFGIAFYPQHNPEWIYVGNLNSVVRIPYRSGDLKARGAAETIVPKLADTTGGHTTRDVAFSLDGKRMFISVGSGSNVAEGMEKKSPEEIRAWAGAHALGAAWGSERNRANVLVADPLGHDLRAYATGIRNPVGLAVQPGTGKVWVSTNERDGLGDDLVPDYVTHIEEGGYYGWPWYYMGSHEEPRLAGERPDLAGRAIVPDVPEQAHSASLCLTFYPQDASGPSAFPAEYRGQIFVALHGSWNRTGRTGSKIVRVRLVNGVATGDYVDFMTGFVVNDGAVWGRPVGVTVAHDGSLLVSDDAEGKIWRVSYRGK
ncbi:MAG TPA: PQQ-dependent sugar dehydrogenase [Opitutus sp.]|nr:PQQ-dependent sugar dehydrogenase [Opitutus sp.]